MRANIRFSHIGSARYGISEEVYDYLRLMNREDDDNAGHLLAHCLGGSGATFNFSPQSPMLNRAVSVAGSALLPSCWRRVEMLISDYLKANTRGYVFQPPVSMIIIIN